jgi:hypothetical protein
VGDSVALSDDTAIMKAMVRKKSLWLIPDAWGWWVPRETWAAFLWRLYDRGPGTVEYHVFARRGWIFWSIMSGFILTLGWVAVFIDDPEAGTKLLLLATGLIALSARLFARNWAEAAKIAPLHVAVIFAVGFGVLKGLAVNTLRWLKGDLAWIKKA